MPTEYRNPEGLAEARQRLATAAAALAEMSEGERLPEDWQQRMVRYRQALSALLEAEQAA